MYKDSGGRSGELTTLEGVLSYTSVFTGGDWYIRGQIRSEFYGISDPDQILRYQWQGAYRRYLADIDVKFLLDFQRHQYVYQKSTDFDLLLAHMSASYPLNNTLSVFGSLFTGGSELNNGTEASGKLWGLEILFSKNAGAYLSYGGGLHYEDYHSQRDGQVSFTPRSFRKWGPVLSAEYLKQFIIRIRYRYLFSVNHDGTEQYLRFVGGKIIRDRWSVFLLIDYYLRSSNFEILTSLNIENRIFLKSGYLISDRTEVYLKIGYFRDEYDGNPLKLSRLNLLLGFEIRS